MVGFRDYTKKALVSSINDSIQLRLKSALNMNEQAQREEHTEVKAMPIDANNSEPKIFTTEEELEAFHIVKAILREKIPAERIAARDTQSYFGVLLDDNNRKPLCRFHFNSNNKYIELFHKGKDAGEKKAISDVDEIYGYRKDLHLTIENY
ncbi:hypothetical protein D9M68_688740 [compost metagenome]